ncbi:hypothetical protein D3C80_1763070 [compost metagenome]
MCLSDFFAREMPGARQRDRAKAVAGKVGLKASTVQKYFQLDRYPSPRTLDKISSEWPALDVSAWRSAFLEAQSRKGGA